MNTNNPNTPQPPLDQKLDQTLLTPLPSEDTFGYEETEPHIAYAMDQLHNLDATITQNHHILNITIPPTTQTPQHKYQIQTNPQTNQTTLTQTEPNHQTTTHQTYPDAITTIHKNYWTPGLKIKWGPYSRNNHKANEKGTILKIRQLRNQFSATIHWQRTNQIDNVDLLDIHPL